MTTTFDTPILRKTAAALAVAGLALSFGSSANAAPGGEFARGRILIEARAGLPDDELDKLVKAHGGKRRKLGQSRMHVVDLPPGLSEEAAVEKLSRRPELKFAELDRKVSSAMAVNDPYIGSAWHIGKIGASTAWDSSQGGGVTIAVLDTGVNAAHPDLKDRIVAGFNVYNNTTDTSDLCGHGTAVAGTAAASTNNAIGVAGVAGAARIMPVRVAYKDASGACPAYFSTIASGITWAADHGARIANVSFVGIAGSAAVKSAARYMKGKGGLVFISAGNNNVDENVAPDDAFIIVSSTDSDDRKSSFSSWGSFVSLTAPGSGIWSTNNALGYSAWNGTSFASPVAAGVAGLMMAARPDMASDQIESLLFATSVDLGTVGRDTVFGHGRVNAAAAVGAARAWVNPVDTSVPAAAIATPLGSSAVSGLVAVSVDAFDNVGVARVDLKVNGTTVASDSAAPYSFSWNSTGVANGMASLVAVAVDAAGNAGASAAVAVSVANSTPAVASDTLAPVVAIGNPVAGTVSGTVAVSVSASDNAGAAGIRTSLSIDGKVVANGQGGSLSYSWNSRKAAAGTHTIAVTARDAAGNASSKTVSVSVR